MVCGIGTAAGVLPSPSKGQLLNIGFLNFYSNVLEKFENILYHTYILIYNRILKIACNVLVKSVQFIAILDLGNLTALQIETAQSY